MPDVAMRVELPLPADPPMVKGSAAWIRPKVATLRVSAHFQPVRRGSTVTPEWRLYATVEVRGHSRDSARWARGSALYRLPSLEDFPGYPPEAPWLAISRHLYLNVAHSVQRVIDVLDHDAARGVA